MRSLDGLRDDRKWRDLRFQRAQLLPEQAKLRIGEAGRHAANVSQLTLLIGQAEQQ